MRRTGVVRRAVVFLDHDEYGSEHIVVTRDDAGLVRRVHHVFVVLRLPGRWLTAITISSGSRHRL
jgi:hypothetical protein